MSGRFKVGPAKKRPPANTLLPVMFAPGAWEDGRHRLRPEAERQLVAELRCPRKRHLIAVVVRTEYGPWAAWWESHFTGNSWTSQPGLGCDPLAVRMGSDRSTTELAGCTCRTRHQAGFTDSQKLDRAAVLARRPARHCWVARMR